MLLESKMVKTAKKSSIPGTGELMIGGTIFSAGLKAGLQSSCIREQGKKMEALSDEYVKGWTSLEASQDILANNEKSEHYKILDKMSTISAQMRINRKKYSETYKQIQFAGIFVIVVVFFLLLLKTFGLLSYIGDIIMLPFTLFTKGGKKE